jgi:hypothetical protein
MMAHQINDMTNNHLSRLMAFTGRSFREISLIHLKGSDIRRTPNGTAPFGLAMRFKTTYPGTPKRQNWYFGASTGFPKKTRLTTCYSREIGSKRASAPYAFA